MGRKMANHQLLHGAVEAGMSVLQGGHDASGRAGATYRFRRTDACFYDKRHTPGG